MKQRNILLMLWMLLNCVSILNSCKKTIQDPVLTASPKSFSDIFDDFWDKMNINYVYWDIDTTNWSRIYNSYKPIFDNLDINNANDVRKSVAYFRQITAGLIDSHYAITFGNRFLTDTTIFPVLERKVKSPLFHSPFLYIAIDTVNYLDKNYVSGTFYSASENENIFALCGTIHQKILYFSCNGFALREAYSSNSGNSVKIALNHFFDSLAVSPLKFKGIVIDVRNNNGGDIEDLNFLLGHLINKPLQFGFSRYKAGNGRLQYTPWINATVLPVNGTSAITVPIIVLADNYSASLAEAVTMAIHAMPNGKFIGETTWGATGPITNSSVYNDGPFSVGSFLNVTTSSAEFRYIDGKSYESTGFPPDISIPFNFDLLYSGVDSDLEKAISLVN